MTEILRHLKHRLPAGYRVYLGTAPALAIDAPAARPDLHVHRRPSGFSFADAIAGELEMPQPPFAAPMAISFRVGEPAATGGHLLAIWRRPLKARQALPSLPLPLNVHQSVPVDLESTYMTAAADAYLA